MHHIGKTRIPAIGFGTYPLQGSEAQQAVEMAIGLGYRHIDTAQMYGNEKAVGQALRSCGLALDEVMVTTKVDPSNMDPERFLPSVERSLEDLGIDSVDYLLLHWPSRERALGQTLELLAEARSRGYSQHIGVSNFTCAQLREAGRLLPGEIATNQVEFHPLIDQRPLQRLCREQGVILSAYCALARGAFMEDRTLQSIARVYGKSVAQVALRWIIQQGVAAIAMSTRLENARGNLDVFDFELSDDEMKAIGALRQAHRRLVSPAQWAPEWDGPAEGDKE
ncbi:oxidoreductase [Marinobacterium nitratireducens]|uniref:Oxidoreductase n=1 Tax=Marinobacterium nitratireducens TaxID=518897 RepID=A0A918DVJ9_9GAMM|nr:aldo/keto reductase [Marinobacterium nitratireducens]GGO83920.1 oxidoreductase [Marinobacterium nitratireducens]